jgi:hypothetical protein
MEMHLAIGILSLSTATKNLSMKVIHENKLLKPVVFFFLGGGGMDPFESQVKATNPF